MLQSAALLRDFNNSSGWDERGFEKLSCFFGTQFSILVLTRGEGDARVMPGRSPGLREENPV